MRRKNTRSSSKLSPEKVKEEKSSKKTRRQSKRHKQTSSESESEDEIKLQTLVASEGEQSTANIEDDTDKVWKVTPTEVHSPNDIQKIKICLTRPAPVTPERTSKRLRNKPNYQIEDETLSEEKGTRRTRRRGAASPKKEEEEVEEKKGKGKSKGKHKSKLENTSQINETEMQSEISENVQVTAQSPQIDNVDINDVDNDHDLKPIEENTSDQDKNIDKDKDICDSLESTEDSNDNVDTSSNDISNNNVTVENSIPNVTSDANDTQVAQPSAPENVIEEPEASAQTPMENKEKVSTLESSSTDSNKTASESNELSDCKAIDVKPEDPEKEQNIKKEELHVKEDLHCKKQELVSPNEEESKCIRQEVVEKAEINPEEKNVVNEEIAVAINNANLSLKINVEEGKVEENKEKSEIKNEKVEGTAIDDGEKTEPQDVEMKEEKTNKPQNTEIKEDKINKPHDEELKKELTNEPQDVIIREENIPDKNDDIDCKDEIRLQAEDEVEKNISEGITCEQTSNQEITILSQTKLKTNCDANESLNIEQKIAVEEENLKEDRKDCKEKKVNNEEIIEKNVSCEQLREENKEDCVSEKSEQTKPEVIIECKQTDIKKQIDETNQNIRSNEKEEDKVTTAVKEDIKSKEEEITSHVKEEETKSKEKEVITIEVKEDTISKEKIINEHKEEETTSKEKKEENVRSEEELSSEKIENIKERELFMNPTREEATNIDSVKTDEIKLESVDNGAIIINKITESKEQQDNSEENKKIVEIVENKEKNESTECKGESVQKTTDERRNKIKASDNLTKKSSDNEEDLQINKYKLSRDKSKLNENVTEEEKPTASESQKNVNKSNHSKVEKMVRTRRWSITPKTDFNKVIEISSETIKSWHPEMKLLQEEDVKLEVTHKKERLSSVSKEDSDHIRYERKVSIDDKAVSDNSQHEIKEISKPEVPIENIIAMNRKISIVNDEASTLRPPPSPAKNVKSAVLFLTNLVRPFTIKQLKELLERTGSIKENGFWTDRIKSKCYVHYQTEEEAEATRNALHGVHWPIGNGKKLMIDYSTPEDLELARNPPVAPAPPPAPEPPGKENQEPPVKKSRKESEGEPEKEEISRSNVWEKEVRKEDLHKRRSRSRERIDKRRYSRSRHSRSPSHDTASKKTKKEEPVPQRAMDDLFRKTEATPCIYWQPLSDEEIALKQQQRLERMAEHKRRMETQTRSKRGSDHSRGAPYRRRY